MVLNKTFLVKKPVFGFFSVKIFPSNLSRRFHSSEKNVSGRGQPIRHQDCIGNTCDGAHGTSKHKTGIPLPVTLAVFFPGYLQIVIFFFCLPYKK